MDIISKFNLPKYIKGKSFAEASKCIAKKFKGRTSPEDLATLNDLQGRLRQAQEFIKAEKEKRSRPQTNDMPDGAVMPGANYADASQTGSEQTNEYEEGGGLLSKLFAKDTSGAEGKVGVGGYMQAATGALDMANTAFGKPNIDTSGATAAPDVPSQGASAAMGAIKGMQAGKAFGPWGAGIGAVVGAGAGIIGGKKAQDAAVEANWQHTSAQHNKATNNYKSGGKLLANMYEPGGDTDPENPYAEYEQTLAEMKAGINRSNQLSFNAMGLGEDDLDAMKMEQDTKDLNNFSASLPDSKSYLDHINDIQTNNVDEDEEEDKFNPAELLRYAPAAINAAQLASLKKPGEIGLDRLGNEYDRQLVDERGLQNVVQRGTANVRDAILGSTGGSGSAARANLLASQLQGTKALSGAYQKATEANRQENRTAQQFNLGVDRANLAQSNQEESLNLEQQAAYQTNKSKLLSQIGQDLGGVGQEELFKRYPELMGLSYDWKGEHLASKKRKKNKKKDSPGKN